MPDTKPHQKHKGDAQTSAKPDAKPDAKADHVASASGSRPRRAAQADPDPAREAPASERNVPEPGRDQPAPTHASAPRDG